MPSLCDQSSDTVIRFSPGEPGAILEYRKELAVGELMPGDRTPLVELPDQIFLYTERGEGRLDDGRRVLGFAGGNRRADSAPRQTPFRQQLGQAADDADGGDVA